MTERVVFPEGGEAVGRRPARGTLVLVVGPSGAGKDSLIARAAVTRPDLRFARRVITRVARAGDEPSCALSESAFAALRRQGRFALDWRAHGLGYGVRAGIAARLRAGESVVVNASRGVVGAARARFGPCRVILVTAPLEVRAARLAARGREDAPDIAERLRRGEARMPDCACPQACDTVTVENGGAFDAALARFIAALPPARSA